VKIEFDAYATKNPSMGQEVTKPGVKKFDIVMLPIEQDKAVSFIPLIDFIIPN
jgi:hypothetical protein